MFEKLINNVQDKYKKYKEESSLYNDLLNKTKILENLITIPNIDKTKITVSYKDILEICPDLNEQKALIIRGILPLNELYLTVLYAKECKTNIFDLFWAFEFTFCFNVISLFLHISKIDKNVATTISLV